MRRKVIARSSPGHRQAKTATGLFGVTSLKIDPQIIGPESIPQAQMALQQQITKDLSFTYIQDLASSNPQVIRIEWAMSPVWFAVATREPDGEFGIDLYYRWQFH